MPGHTQLKWYYQFEENFNVYLQANNQRNPSCFPWDVAKILETCFLGSLGIPGSAHPKR